ncbi:hypothetical protein AGMMS50268_16520 [Spirochaetia bacterium]|nr:hypothetical protein AGMMS50268_16520 [Spirochaetia bacterium]
MRKLAVFIFTVFKLNSFIFCDSPGNQIIFDENFNVEGLYIRSDFYLVHIFLQDNVLYVQEGSGIPLPIIQKEYLNNEFHIVYSNIPLIIAGDKRFYDRVTYDGVIYKENEHILFDRNAGKGSKMLRNQKYMLTDLFYSKEDFQNFQKISFNCRGVIQKSENEVWMIFPKYPKMLIARILINDNFIVENIIIGEILPINNKMIICFPFEKIDFYDVFIEGQYYENLNEKIKWEFPIIGDRLEYLETRNEDLGDEY